MSTLDCEIIGTGDGKLKKACKNELTFSKDIAKDLVSEIIDNALEIVEDTSEMTIEEIMEKISNKTEEYKVKHLTEISGSRDKSTAPLKGTGDQKSNEDLSTEETVFQHPPVEKKNRLTDLVKNSKQILAKLMMSESKSLLQEKQEETVINVIELDCVQVCDLPFKIKPNVRPEDVPLPQNDSHEIINPPSEESMDEIRLSTSPESNSKEIYKNTMTFPRASGSKAKAAFAAKCRTLKMGASNLKKKKWDVGGKIANFFKKKRHENKSSLKESQIDEDELKQVEGPNNEETENK